MKAVALHFRCSFLSFITFSQLHLSDMDSPCLATPATSLRGVWENEMVATRSKGEGGTY